MSQNGIAHLSTKELRQKAKLDLAAANRAARSNARSTYDLTELPSQYVNNAIYDNPNGSGLIKGRPWINTTSFTFYEAFGTTSALETTRYNVTGNKIYAYSSTFDVVGFQNARVVVNDIEVLNSNLRGHNMVVLNSYGDVVSTATYDTYGTVGQTTALATALNNVATGNIVVLTVYDASALDSGIRTALNTHYGSTNNNTWTATRIDQIFIGIKS
jgi:Interleukin-like EMT inducer